MRIDKFLGAGFAALAFVLGVGDALADAPVSDVVARLHFIGTQQLAANPLATNLNQILALPESVALRDKTLDKLAVTPFRMFKAKFANHNTNDYFDLLRPLLDDFVRVESYIEVRGPTNTVPEMMLAVHLEAKQAALWQTNLATVIAGWTGIPVQPISGDGFTGWELKKHHDPNVIRCLRCGEWVLFGWGWDDLKLQPEFVQRIKDTQGPVAPSRNDFLDFWVDWPAISPYHALPWDSLFPGKLPRMHLTIQPRQTARGYEVRPQLLMQFPHQLEVQLPFWHFPTNTIRNPIVSFTAARGLQPWLKELEIVKDLNVKPVPDQFCIWAMAKVPFETYMATPINNSSNLLAEVAPRLLPIANEFLTNRTVRTEAIWTNDRVIIPQTPFILPSLRAMHEPSGDFLLGSLFAMPQRKNSEPMPQDLIREIYSKKNMVYYDWEINKSRISQWHQIFQIYLMTSGKALPAPTMPGQMWLTAVSTNLGNCGTEITVTAPNELTLVRNASLGLTGFELNLLTYWLDSAGFPLDAHYESKHSRSLPPSP